MTTWHVTGQTKLPYCYITEIVIFTTLVIDMTQTGIRSTSTLVFHSVQCISDRLHKVYVWLGYKRTSDLSSYIYFPL